MYSDEIIEAVGGMSRFQIMLVFGILGPKIIMAGGMLMMAFAAVPPEEWWCVDSTTEDMDGTDIDAAVNSSLKQCPSYDNGSRCTFVYSTEKDTVIDEWNLLCDKSTIPPTITAVQLGGVLVGCVFTGFLADAVGRKKTYYLSMVLHASANVIAAFSTSWQMFMAIRFCIGFLVGGLLCVYFPYFMEFVGQRWRPITGAIPFWPTGEAVLALITWLRPKWSDAHLIVAAIHIPFFLGWFFVPESLRWLAIRGRLKEAEKVVDQMARYNGTVKPADTQLKLKLLAEEERTARESGAKYSYIDIYRGWKLLRTSILIQVIWFCVSFVFYGISFGVGHLTGNLYLNMFLIAVVDVPGLALSYFLNNKIGRRWAGFFFFTVATAGAAGVTIVSNVVSNEDIRGPLTTALALVCRIGVAAGWCCMQVHTTETYPTAIRNLGYGGASTVARAGSIISPYAFSIGNRDDLTAPFLMVGSAMLLCTVLSLVLKETLGVPLEDTTLNMSKHDRLLITEEDLQHAENTKL